MEKIDFSLSLDVRVKTNFFMTHVLFLQDDPYELFK